MAARQADPDLVAAPPKPRRFHDLGARVLSGVLLAALGVGAAAAGGPWLAAAAAAAVIAMSFEWARMSEPGALRSAFGFLAAGALGAVLAASLGALGWAVAWLAGCAALSAWRRFDWNGRLETGLGAVYVGAPAALLIWLRAEEGALAILFLFAVIWAADIFAYLGGVLLGGPRVHVALSPQKTWSGLICGAAAGAGAAYLFARVIGAAAPGLCAAAGLGFAAMGLAGDLIESFLKRRFGVKDASGFIPGHGGVLDRIDGLMAATFAAAALAAAFPHWPAQLLGFGR